MLSPPMLNDARQSPTEYNLPALAVSHLGFDVFPINILFKDTDTLKNNFGVSIQEWTTQYVTTVYSS